MRHRLTTIPALSCLLSMTALAGIPAVHASTATPATTDALPDGDKETVVLLHGLGRGKSAMWLLGERLEKAGYRVERIGYPSLRDDPRKVLAGVRAQIDSCCAQREQPVHFVGHSLGGLLARAYLADKPVRTLGRVVLIGSPSQGTPLVDAYRDTWWMKIAGPTANALGTGADSFPRSLPAPDYPLGVIAGKRERHLEYPVIEGDDDGLVPVEATRVEGMQDFVVVEAGHAQLRYDERTAELTVAFLKSGKFTHTD